MAEERPNVTLPILESELLRIIDTALAEDLSMGDVTTDSLVDPEWRAEGVAIAKEGGILAGMSLAIAVFNRLDPAIQCTPLFTDGARIQQGDVIAQVSGPAGNILRAERVALNFVQRLSGVATETARYVEAVKDLPVRVTETRKTTPGLRTLEKYAVRVGGGHNHRQNLADGVLIKDNHLEAAALAGYTLTDAVRRAKAQATHMVRIEVEVETLDQVREAAASGADWILLDNMPVDMMGEAVRIIGGRTKVEASGGITIENIRAIAETGVDLVSSGALTHSYKALDISLKLRYQVTSV